MHRDANARIQIARVGVAMVGMVARGQRFNRPAIEGTHFVLAPFVSAAAAHCWRLGRLENERPACMCKG